MDGIGDAKSMQLIDRETLKEYHCIDTPLLPIVWIGISAFGQSAGCSAFHIKEMPTMYGSNGETEWFVCRTCQKFTPEVNEYGICRRCSDGDRAPAPVMFASYMHHVAPISPTGRVLSESQWKRITQQVSDFYRYIPETHQSLWNASVSDRRRRYKAPDPKEGYIYLIEAETGYFKVGRSYDVEVRLSQHEMDYPMKMWVIHSFRSSNVKADERRLLNAFKPKQLRGEWFELEPFDVEWFKTIEDFSMSAAFLKFKSREKAYKPKKAAPQKSALNSLSEHFGKIARRVRGIWG